MTAEQSAGRGPGERLHGKVGPLQVNGSGARCADYSEDGAPGISFTP